jgi:hypothetical protein
VEAQTAQAETMPIAQCGRRCPRIRDGDAAKPARITFQRVAHYAVVVAVRVALHDDAMREAEMIEQREILLDRARPAACSHGPAAKGNLSAGPKMCAWVSQAPGRRRDGRTPRRGDRPRNQRRLCVGQMRITRA